MNINYKLLLEKYMHHVAQCEGTDFVDRINDGLGSSDVEFTEAERAVLRAVHEKGAP